MGLISKARTSVALSRKAEEALYEIALDEFDGGKIRRGLWAQALAEAQGDESRAKGTYLKLRVRSLQDDGAIIEELIASGRVSSADAPLVSSDSASSPGQALSALNVAVMLIGLVLLGFVLFEILSSVGP